MTKILSKNVLYNHPKVAFSSLWVTHLFCFALALHSTTHVSPFLVQTVRMLSFGVIPSYMLALSLFF